ncbi:type II secretion system protein GspD [Selenihalanaerobacter shriftii]|uniref:Type IV pilus assembly protein PilQ n=1 Tax=Selenihalanaerobacter shriftii TaxID=142842 RepID=A0A1T4JR52_9FIRM|nr:secretin N-terminal domain-containing protein [Selenihalanaerobacter shriftii]SJZ32605.1 type IV pilus assembly protein PilQ [Selenihalanaerobacter shriftii]
MKIQKNQVIILVIFLLMIIPVMQINGSVDAKEKKKEPLVTMVLFETDLREALNEISLQTGVDIIPDQTVNGVVTADLQEVPLKKALRRILIGGGYTFRKIDDFYLVGLPTPKNPTFKDLSEIKVVKLKHITVREVFDILPSFLKSYVKGSPRSNVLTIHAPVREQKRIYELIDAIDKPQQQVEIKVVVTEIDSKKVKEIGTKLLSYNKGEQGIKRGKYDSVDDLLVLETDHYGKLLTELRVLEEEEKAKIKANPRVLVADGETAELFVGDQETLLITPEDDDITSRTEEIEVGVKLRATADIIGEDKIVLNITPQISHFVNEVRPDILVKKNSVSTTLRLKSGQTAVVAGMTMQNDYSQDKKVPVLGDVPLVRWFFKNKKERKTDRELLVFVTPVIK